MSDYLAKAIKKDEDIHAMMGDQLRFIAKLIPYLEHRQRAAYDYYKTNNEELLQYIEHMNSEIKKVLCL